MKRRNSVLSSILCFGLHANIAVLCGVLLGSLYIQVVLGEFPCPLCMVQRISMMLCALGQAYILSRVSADGRLEWRDFMRGHGMTLFAALGGAAMSIRQILLHIVPPDPGYGGAILGYHLYTWGFLVFCAEILAVGLCLALTPRGTFVAPAGTARWTGRIFLLLGLVILAFAVATFIEEGFHWTLPDDPTGNRLWEDLGLRPPLSPWVLLRCSHEAEAGSKQKRREFRSQHRFRGV